MKKLLRTLFPHPALAVAIIVLWLALHNVSSLGQAFLAVIIAIILPILTHPFWPEPPPQVRLGAAFRLFCILLWDILMASLEVARLVLGPLDRIHSSFVDIPLDIEDPFVGTLLAGIVSLTPGTVSIDIIQSQRILRLHVLNVEDQAATIAFIKARYETPLKEIFSC